MWNIYVMKGILEIKDICINFLFISHSWIKN